MHSKYNKGFTLIELLVIVAIISLLASILLVSMQGAKEKARIAKAQAEIRQIATAMYLFKEKYGELPPIGDNCSACMNPCDDKWKAVMDALVNEGLMGTRVDKDPWGNYYCYDDNDNDNNNGICCGGCSPLYSMGPNEQNDSFANTPTCPRVQGCPKKMCKDDIGIILPEGNTPYPW